MFAPRSVSRSATVAAGLVAALALSCGGGGSPSSSTPPTTVPQASPTPSGGGPVALSCPLGKGSKVTACQRNRASHLLADVEAAINRVVGQRPAFLDLKDEARPNTGQYRILDQKAYVAAVVANLTDAGDCAEADYDLPYEVIHAKDTNDFSESFDLVLSGGYMRRGIGMYRESCNPADFPVDPDSSAPPSGSGCGKPYPPQISRFNSKVNIKGPDYYTLDSTPIIGPNLAYCTAIGYTDGRSLCPVRMEHGPEREACETWRVGYAKDTGRPGPTWILKTNADPTGHYCTGPESGCAHDPNNAYELWAYTGGTYVMCGENGACGQVIVER
jgi:hypothetical protein